MAENQGDQDSEKGREYPVSVGDLVDDKYLVEDVIGSSSMSVVFAAQHLHLAQRVAIKFLFAPGGEWTKEGVERFRVEARTMARVRSPHVVRILDVGTHKNVPYIVMEHLDGEDLARISRTTGPMTSAQAATYMLQAAEGIAAVHAAGIVHRDVKPSNLFVTDEGGGTWLLKVIDFGIAKYRGQDKWIHHRDGSLTETATLVGSPRYMSPEQITDARDVDGRADIWSLGVITHELITGKRLIPGGSISEVLVKVLTSPIPPLAGVPSAFAVAISKALSRDRSERTATIAEFARDLAPFTGTDQSERLARISRTRSGFRPAVSAKELIASSRPPAAPAAPIGGATEKIHATQLESEQSKKGSEGERVLETDDGPSQIELDVSPGNPIQRGAPNVIATASPITRIAPAVRAVDPVEARLLARFGPPPKHWWQAPAYARRVQARRIELNQELQTAGQHHQAARSAFEDLLVSVARRAAAEIATMAKPPRTSYLKGIERIAKREAELAEKDAAVAAATARQESTLKMLGSKAETLRQQLQAATESGPQSGPQSSELQAQLAAVEHELVAVSSVQYGASSSRDPAVEEARAAFRATCIDFAMHVLQDEFNFGSEYQEQRDRAMLLGDAAAHADQKAAMCRAALGTCDQRAMLVGRIVVAAALGVAALVGLGLGLLLALR